jgi:hypothetical protein
MGILVKLVVLAYCLYLLGCYLTGTTMQAPYHTLENTRENSVWRAIEAVVATIGAIAVVYWLALDLL